MRVAFTTLGRFSSGSPCPIMTMLSRPPSRLQSVVARHQQHLADDFAGGQVALQAQQRGHAELAVHRTAHLARDADGVALAFGHQHGLHRAPVVEPQQVAPRAVGGLVAARDLRQAERCGCRPDPRAVSAGSVRDLHQVATPAAGTGRRRAAGRGMPAGRGRGPRGGR